MLSRRLFWVNNISFLLYSSIKYRDWTHDQRPLKYQNVVDPRIVPCTQENPILKCIRYYFKPIFILVSLIFML